MILKKTQNLLPKKIESFSCHFQIFNFKKSLATTYKITMDHALEKLNQVFGFPSLKPGQSKVIEALLVRNESALCVFPTGGGKSLTYQLPAILFPGLTVVVCPLISLMKDQVTFLKSKGIVAEFLNSTLEPDQEAQIYQDLAKPGFIKLLYVAPEKFKNDFFLRALSDVQIDLFVVDEAHCISEWVYSIF
jgi:ATP-dependent DNA helicase RecQ